ncbi:hypothetical protein [Flavobacterium pedocola]
MKLKKLLFCISTLFTLMCNSQEQLNNEPKSIISLSLLTPTASYAPRWNIGYMRKLNERYWIGLDFGYGNNKISINPAEEGGWITDSYKLIEIRPEIYYDLRPKSKLKHLISVELFYIYHKDEFEDNWYYDLNEKKYYEYDFANYKRIKYGTNINYNLIYYLGKKIAFMQKVGIGFRKRNVEYSNIINKSESPNFEEPDGGIIRTNGFIKDNGISNAFNFNLDFKIIYKF